MIVAAGTDGVRMRRPPCPPGFRRAVR
jgi:hypothetical protein